MMIYIKTEYTNGIQYYRNRAELMKWSVCLIWESHTGMTGQDRLLRYSVFAPALCCENTLMYVLIFTALDPKERLIRQRHQLQKRLGLDVGGVLGMDSDDLFNDDDLLTKKDAVARADSNTLKLPVSQFEYNQNL